MAGNGNNGKKPSTKKKKGFEYPSQKRKPTWESKSGPRARINTNRGPEDRNELFRDDQGNPRSQDEIAQIQDVLQKLANIGDERLLDYFEGLCMKALPEMFSVIRDAANAGDTACAKFLIDHGAGRSRESKNVDTGGIDLVNDVFSDEGIDNCDRKNPDSAVEAVPTTPHPGGGA